MMEDIKAVLKVLDLPTAATQHQLEKYRVKYDEKRVNPYLSLQEPMKLTNPLIYWRYFSTPELSLLKKIAEVIFCIVR